ncbi:MAG: electron transfer flavoprotein subunit beta/FixA family protein [Phycisphaerae bacterium]|jgi:electron transfer flavoprotein beta subunit
MSASRSRIVPYHSIVCVKQVPDTANITGEAMRPDGTVNRTALPAVFNPDDLHALETAVRIRDQFGGRVTVLSMGPPKAGDVLREALYRGADRVILLTDRRAAASDTLATSYILAQAIRTIGDYDFVFCGRQAIDGDTAQVGPQCAEKLGLPQVTYLEEVVGLEDRTARLRRNVGNGWEVVEVKLPVLVTVLDTAGEVRPPAAKRVMRYKRARVPAELLIEVSRERPDATDAQKEEETLRRAEHLRSRGLMLEEWNLGDINADLAWCGLSGSPTKVHRVQSIVLTKQGYTEISPTDDGIRRLIQELVVDHTLG